MDNTTLLIIVLLVLIIFGGGYYGRGRWWWSRPRGSVLKRAAENCSPTQDNSLRARGILWDHRAW